MKRLAHLFATLALVLSVSGCLVRSIYPICSENESIKVPGLLGTWQDEKGEVTAIISKSGANTYRVVYLENEKPAIFFGVAAKFGGKMFLDLIPISNSAKNGLEEMSSIPAHVVFRVKLDNNRLEYAYLDPKWMKASIKSGAIKISLLFTVDCETDKKEPDMQSITLDASTEEIGMLLASVAGNEKAFTKPEELKRVK